jgi:hypothetical protein
MMNVASTSPAQCRHSIRRKLRNESHGRRLIPTDTISQNTAAGTISFICGHYTTGIRFGNTDSFQGVILSEVAPMPGPREAPPLRFVGWQSASTSKHLRFFVERERCGCPILSSDFGERVGWWNQLLAARCNCYPLATL